MRLWALILSIAVIFGATPAPAATKSINVVSKSPRVGNLTLYQNSWAVLIGINDYKIKISRTLNSPKRMWPTCGGRSFGSDFLRIRSSP